MFLLQEVYLESSRASIPITQQRGDPQGIHVFCAGSWQLRLKHEVACPLLVVRGYLSFDKSPSVQTELQFAYYDFSYMKLIPCFQ